MGQKGLTVAAAAMVTQSPALSRPKGAANRDYFVRALARTMWLPMCLAIGACSTYDFDSFRAPDLTIVAPRTTATLRDTPLRPVTSEDMIDTSGNCAGVQLGPDPNLPADQQQANTPTIPSAIGLDMTECDVVKRAGQPERFEFGTNERNERTVTLTYIQGPRPGIYRFTAGRLTVIERAPEPPKPVRQQRKPPKRAGT